jgi:hypothetical protein
MEVALNVQLTSSQPMEIAFMTRSTVVPPAWLSIGSTGNDWKWLLIQSREGLVRVRTMFWKGIVVALLIVKPVTWPLSSWRERRRGNSCLA